MLDSGGLSALTERSADAIAALEMSREAVARVVVPSVVIAESLRGDAADARTNRILSGLAVADIGEREAREAARLKNASRMTGVQHTIDALVVAVASVAGGGAILTSDVGDIGVLAEARPEVQIVPIRV
ncbi:MAG: PIN domain-containing protein [Actinomycetota bacterium]|nr:PIN domain-containing protein [Actinomycetota bacterium]